MVTEWEYRQSLKAAGKGAVDEVRDQWRKIVPETPKVEKSATRVRNMVNFPWKRSSSAAVGYGMAA